MQEVDQPVGSLEAKIVARRSRNPLEPIPFELFSEFCVDWSKKYKIATDAVRFQVRKATELQVNQAGNGSLIGDHESLDIQRKGNMKRNETWDLVESMQQYGTVGADCAKLEKKLEVLEKNIEPTESEVMEFEAINRALWEIKKRYRVPSVLQIAQKVEELELAEKQLVVAGKDKLEK